MQIISDLSEMHALACRLRREGISIGLVPTMGAFHEGHLSLMRRARAENDVCLTSLFVNPTQFVRGEDLSRYPRDPEADARMAEGAGCSILFVPETEAVYPEGFATYVEPTRLTDHLCGLSRPGHFRGVATVVLMLFELTRPVRAYFGRKDYQQIKVIERMVKDFHLPVEIVPMPLVRESGGLAMSSRNRYLSTEERRSATVLFRALQAARSRFEAGERNPATIRDLMRDTLLSEPQTVIDYVSVSHPETLEELDRIEERALAALAVRIGPARLIDNTVLGEPMADVFAEGAV
ncbi:MAG: pantoate--beta-alanine ligase [Armatimonadetes bacterium]|nr:pantoate--beta-alanine ligase [Armatimonadota bacterium]